MMRFLLPILFAVSIFAVSASAQEGRVFWRGEVDNKVQLSIKGMTLDEKTISGKPQPAGGYSFTAKLPDLAVTVAVEKPEGRGKVTVLQQPLPENGYTAIIEIHDDKGGTGEYLLNISWQQPS